nr:hypothetical protein Iba_chr12eCG5080 [Ipomoea batatas]
MNLMAPMHAIATLKVDKRSTGVDHVVDINFAQTLPSGLLGCLALWSSGRFSTVLVLDVRICSDFEVRYKDVLVI